MSEVEIENNNNNNNDDNDNDEEAVKVKSSNSPARLKVEWTTWEELLLACAVKRHGLKDWGSVAMELQTRCFPTTATTATFVLTPQTCRDKFRDLQRRFTATNDDVAAAEDDGGDDVTVPWLEELRKLRVAELKQEVHRYDLSIQSLQLKVKRLEEERERSYKENDENDDVKTDLEKDKNTENSVKHEEAERSENDKKGGGKGPQEDVAGKSVSADDENRSFNESNSTDNRGAGSKVEPEPVEVKPETVEQVKPVPIGGEDSCNDSSDRGKASREGKVDTAELRDSVDESKEDTTAKENSDVQSSASLTKNKRKRGGGGGGQGDGHSGGGEKGGGEDATTTTTTTTTAATRREGTVVKSEPLVRFLDIIRSHKHGSMFERRLDAQKADKYKNMIRQHVDLQTIQARIDDGSYSSCANRFYLDLLLVFNNAIVFFPKSSHESIAAHALRDLVMKEIKKNRNPSSDPPPESVSASAKAQPKPDPDRSDSLLAKHKSTAPLVVCRKRSSITAKAASSTAAAAAANKVEKLADNKPLLGSKPVVKSSSSTQNEDDSSIKLKLKEMPVTGFRSMRRSSKGRPTNNATQSNTNSNQNTSSSSQQQQQSGSTQKGDGSKTDKKKHELNNAAAKKRGAADFLKRMKKNSPGKGSSVEALTSSADDSRGGKSDQQKKKVEERKDAGPLRRSGNGNGKQAKEDNSPSKRSVGRPPKKGKEAPAGKRGRESGEGEGSSKRPSKRSRR